MSRKKQSLPISGNTNHLEFTKLIPSFPSRKKGLTLTQARQKAVVDSQKAQQAQAQYAEAEAKLTYDYKVDE